MNFYTKFKKLPTFVLETLSTNEKQLLNEIIKTQQTRTNVPAFDEEKLKQQRDQTKKNISMDSMTARMNDEKYKGPQTGYFAKGEQDANDPHMYNKSVYMPVDKLKTDPYQLYVMQAAKYAKSNPYFPRVYQINTQVDPNHKKLPSYKMETLKPYSAFDIDMLLSVANRINKEMAQQIKTKLENGASFSEKYRTSMVADGIGQYLALVVEGHHDVNSVQDPKLRQCLTVIKTLIAKYPVGNDIHADNIMFRATPIGPQLVITDPLQPL